MCARKVIGSTLGLTALVLVVGYLIFGSKLTGYLEMAYDRVVEGAEEAVPPEVELERIRGEVADLKTDIASKRHQLANANVEADLANQDVVALRKEVNTWREALMARAKELNAAKGLVKYNGELVSVDTAHRKLSDDYDRFEAMEHDLAVNESRAQTLKDNSDHLKKLLEALVTQQREMESAVAELESALQALELEQVQSKYQDDNSRLSDIKDSIAKLRKRVAVQREDLRLADEYAPRGAPVKTPGEILNRLEGSTTE